MNVRSNDLVSLIGSRICHDLISPIGAIGNGIELISLTGSGSGPEMALISESVNNAQARIRFYRIAFGASNGGQNVAGSEAAEIMRDIYGTGRLSVTWEPRGEVRRAEAKLLFLLVQCLESAMPHGGRIVVAASNGRWTTTGSAAKFRNLAEFWDLLREPSAEAEVGPDTIQFALAPLQAADLGRRLDLQISPTDIRIAF
ncbi:MAG: histidine phosphotransferase [Rhodobacteraceae bacterium]|nr:histidine phosphotransferase [Paracoccaceae bacterium]